MRLSTESQLLIAALRSAGGEVTMREDEADYSQEAIDEVTRAGLVKSCDGSGWSTTITLKLTRDGLRHCGLTVPPSFMGRIRFIRGY